MTCWLELQICVCLFVYHDLDSCCMCLDDGLLWTLLCTLTHWGRDKMAAISQTRLSNAFSSTKLLEMFFKVPINNIPALVQIMAWRRSGDKPFSEPMFVRLLTHICVIRPQWLKSLDSMQCNLMYRQAEYLLSNIFLFAECADSSILYEMNCCRGMFKSSSYGNWKTHMEI